MNTNVTHDELIKMGEKERKEFFAELQKYALEQRKAKRRYSRRERCLREALATVANPDNWDGATWVGDGNPVQIAQEALDEC